MIFTVIDKNGKLLTPFIDKDWTHIIKNDDGDHVIRDRNEVLVNISAIEDKNLRDFLTSMVNYSALNEAGDIFRKIGKDDIFGFYDTRIRTEVDYIVCETAGAASEIEDEKVADFVMELENKDDEYYRKDIDYSDVLKEWFSSNIPPEGKFEFITDDGTVLSSYKWDPLEETLEIKTNEGDDFDFDEQDDLTKGKICDAIDYSILSDYSQYEQYHESHLGTVVIFVSNKKQIQLYVDIQTDDYRSHRITLYEAQPKCLDDFIDNLNEAIEMAKKL